MKTFIVDFDKTWGEDSTITVRAKNKEAKKKGWERFKRRVKKRRDYNIYADEI